jgi:hypothetical protein
MFLFDEIQVISLDKRQCDRKNQQLEGKILPENCQQNGGGYDKRVKVDHHELPKSLPVMYLLGHATHLPSAIVGASSFRFLSTKLFHGRLLHIREENPGCNETVRNPLTQNHEETRERQANAIYKDPQNVQEPLHLFFFSRQDIPLLSSGGSRRII